MEKFQGLNLTNENISDWLEHHSILFDMIILYYAIADPQSK
ncbi:hypothetical protein SAMN02746065_110137 [Desulfocicer vacuolatum DSM 3385]|uniref:Uncharacterized protein n=1 Tax=Desulfocicer vacuolatum DSM 3385 TaxID=1121400 RepID=A0A1W2C495_9BACT|nr:hypothetical protein [Desulfocicer vacuolatum]SMC80055.1 hypothetical protein SAMN02746065_110137 [Desulfocicer vacuolatum DSM 3385]